MIITATLLATLLVPLAPPPASTDPAPDQTAQSATIAEAAQTPEGLVRALYAMCSFDAGPEPDWEIFRDAFLEDALIVFSARGDRPMRPLSVDGFIQDWRDFYRDAELVDKGFYETIASLEVTEFGGMAHAFVIFEPQIGKEPPARQIRGLDSIEMSFDGERWWVAAITTDYEGPDQTIPVGVAGTGH